MLRRSVAVLLFASCLVSGHPHGFRSIDLAKFRSVGDVRFSPDGGLIAYVVSSNSNSGRPQSRLHVLNLADEKSVAFGKEADPSSEPEWAPDGRWIAFRGKQGNQSGLFIARPDGSSVKFIAPLEWTNGPLPMTGKRVAWSPDSRYLAFVSSTPGPETTAATGDPVVITRYLYKPDLDEGLTRFNDNRRTHIFLADLSSGKVQQLTFGVHCEHSIDWSPDGQEILFVSNREPDGDQFFNYDVYALMVAGGQIRRLCATESAEYVPQWSPDGRRVLFLATRRGLTDLETAMEDTHIWVMNADGTGRRELGATVDNRQDAPGWSEDGSAIYFRVQSRGNVRLYRMPATGGAPQVVVDEPGSVSSWSVRKDGAVAYSFTSARAPAQLCLQEPGRPRRVLIDLNAEVFTGKDIAEVEAFAFVSNDHKWEVEAYLTKPLGLTPQSTHPLIVTIHGGPHAQQGPAFNFKNQVYAGLGWATLMVNYRGSTGYGQGFADAVFGDQNGNEAMDVLYGVSATMRRYPWIDRDRIAIEGQSYGGQLTAWLITQTRLFKAAILMAPVINLISYNYTTYYNQYEEMEYGARPHQGNLMDELWQRSALRRVAQISTPALLLHGENDNDVPISETEQLYIALKDVGVETVMVRYPREGHGVRETGHVIDSIDRSIAWCREHFPPAYRPSPKRAAP